MVRDLASDANKEKVNATQLANDYTFSFRFSRTINFNKKKPALFEESGK